MGMMCAGCSGAVERRLNQLKGVNNATVNLAARTAHVEYDPAVITPQEMKKEIHDIGYEMVLEEDDTDVEAERRKGQVLLRRKVLVAWLLAVATMCITMRWLPVGSEQDANFAAMLLSLAAMVGCGGDFYKNATKQVLHVNPGMDTLVALSTLIAFLFSVFNTFWGTVWSSHGLPSHTYFDAPVMIIAFILTGRLIESRAKDGTASAIRALMGMTPKQARVVVDGAVRQVPVATLKLGDVVELRVGDKVPVDGVVSSGEAYVDESMLTGEPVPARRGEGEKVYAGCLVKSGTAQLTAREVGTATVLAHIIDMVQQAQGSKAPVQRVVDRIARYFVPAVLLIAVLTLAAWVTLGGVDQLPRAVMSAVSVLVIACPCAMGLATPTALMVGMGKAAQKGILIKDAAALEQLRRVDAVVLDKTGTLTIPRDDVDFTQASALTFDQRETLKPHAREAVEALRAAGVEVHMMSGDNDEAAAHWAREAGIDHYRSRVLPQDKEDLVRQLQSQGRVVAMVGDGINDSQALAAADVSIAMGRGTDVAMDVAQVTLMGDDLRRIPQAMRLSRGTVGMIHQNLFWAFIYNVVCIPLAAGALHGVLHFEVTPMMASALMAFSSVSVVLNSLRLKLMK